MTYSTGTLTSTTPGQAFIAAIGTALGAVTGWSKVTSARVEGTFTWDVWKSAGANNSFGTDFYVALGYVTASGLTVKYSIFEGWNASTFQVSSFPPNSSQTPSATTYLNPQAANSLPSTGTTLGYVESASFVTTGFNYGISVTADRFHVWARNGTADFAFYAGLYDPFLPLASDPFPLCIVQFAPNGGASGAGGSATPTTTNGLNTRAPLQSGASSTNFTCGANGSAGSSWTINLGAAAEGYTGKIVISRTALQGNATGYLRGLLKDIYSGPSQTQNGDTITWTLNSVAHTSVRLGGVSSWALYGDQL